jgi:uncharacterized membrane protein
MPITPEERKKIYEEEKARLEVREQLQKEKGGTQSSSETTLNLTPNVAGLLCYLFGWISGIVFFVMEQKNKWIRFHAAQSIIVFGFLCILTFIFWWIPWIGWIFGTIIWICGFILWVLLMYKAYQGEYFKLPVVGIFAESMAGSTVNASPAPPHQTPPASAPPPPPPPPPSSRKKK